MQKFLLPFLFFTFFSFSQINKPFIKSIIVDDLTFFKFEKGKLKSMENKNRATTFYTYNNKGLLESEYYSTNTTKAETKYKYDENGYVINLITYEMDILTNETKPLFETTITYDFKANNDYIITCTTKGLSYSYDLLIIYEKIGDVLNISEKGKNSSRIYMRKIANGNIVFEEKIKAGRENHSREFKFDTNTNINIELYTSLFGEKYFTNQMVSRNYTFPNTTNEFVNKNNCISVRNVKVTKYLQFSEQDIETVYNSQNYPIQVKVNYSDPIIKVITIVYEDK